jgi:hypothetical protein
MDATPEARRPHRRRPAGAFGIVLIAAAGAVVGRLPTAAIVPVMVVFLAGIDLGSGVVVESWPDTHSGWLMLAGCAMYLVRFWMYDVSLRFGELSTIIVGWVVLVTVSNMGFGQSSLPGELPHVQVAGRHPRGGAAGLPADRRPGLRIGLNEIAHGLSGGAPTRS